MMTLEQLTTENARRVAARAAAASVRAEPSEFELWAERCVTIKDKLTGADIPFRLNSAQRRVLAVMERQRLAGRPIRIILLKARQWGGSTLVQMYMAWIQIEHKTNWHSLICAHVKDTANAIRGMYGKMLAAYPPEQWPGDGEPKFVPYESSRNTRVILGRGCRVTVGSSENQEAVRGCDYAMAHLSEVAFWSDSALRSPASFIRAICGAIARAPLTLIVMESTANGVGNYFHGEWMRAKAGESDKEPVFVAWHEIEIYSEPVADAMALWRSMDAYERGLWERGLTLDQIQWYHNKRREYADHRQMMAEYPTTDIEAFASTGSGVFAVERIEALRPGCRSGARGELHADGTTGRPALRGLRFVADPAGSLEVWAPPCDAAEAARWIDPYVVAVDVGGRSAASDWSVIAVIDRRPEKPEVAAQWRGHVDHDLLAWKAAAIAEWYHRALLVVESNTLETSAAATDGLHGDYILSQISFEYRNLYLRQTLNSATGAYETKYGFHTNRLTKQAAVNDLIAALREGAYIERSTAALDELATFQRFPNGSTGAAPGRHDDIVMTRAIALHVTASQPARRRTGWD